MAEDEGKDLFDTTRGRLLLLLCRGPHTVNELMEELGVTDNAVRAQLVNLQLAGLVCQTGLRPGTRKPHVDYQLTAKARRLFPAAHEPVLRALVQVLRERLTADDARSLLQETARRLLMPLTEDLHSPDPPGPAARAGRLYETLRASAPGLSLDQSPERIEIRACGCPLATLTAAHPQICDILAAVLTDLLGARVTQCCERGDWPKCRFQLAKRDAP